MRAPGGWVSAGGGPRRVRRVGVRTHPLLSAWRAGPLTAGRTSAARAFLVTVAAIAIWHRRADEGRRDAGERSAPKPRDVVASLAQPRHRWDTRRAATVALGLLLGPDPLRRRSDHRLLLRLLARRAAVDRHDGGHGRLQPGRWSGLVAALHHRPAEAHSGEPAAGREALLLPMVLPLLVAARGWAEGVAAVLRRSAAFLAGQAAYMVGLGARCYLALVSGLSRHLIGSGGVLAGNLMALFTTRVATNQENLDAGAPLRSLRQKE